VNEEWGPAFKAIPKPGLVVIPTGDPFLSADGAGRAAEAAGAQTQRLDGRGHWWMLEDPQIAAELLDGFWRSV
jgi:pimeloyl-ACP methyl ester carboxylesterase